MSGEKNHRYGKRPHNFKGTTLHPDGYRLIHQPDHPHAVNRNVFEHRLVMEMHLRSTNPQHPHLREFGGELYLRRDIHVHHINGDKLDNRVENLQTLTVTEHAALHAALRHPT